MLFFTEPLIPGQMLGLRIATQRLKLHCNGRSPRCRGIYAEDVAKSGQE